MTKIQDKKTIESISQIPLNFYVNDFDGEYLSEATLKGFIDIESNTAIPQSSMISIN